MVAGSFYNFSRRYFHLETMYLSSHFRAFIIIAWTKEQSQLMKKPAELVTASVCI